MRIVRADEVTAATADTAKWTSQVWRADILRADSGGLRSNRFTYAPGHRSNWHIHEGEQALIVLSGRGVILWQGLEVAELLGPGDWVHVSPGVPHWHGAVPDDTFEHLAVTATGGTIWGQPVDDPAYRSALSADGPAR